MTARVSRAWAVDQLAAAVLSELATSVAPDDPTGDQVTAEADLSEIPWHLRQEVVDRAAVLADGLVATPRSVATAIAALSNEPTTTTEEDTDEH